MATVRALRHGEAAQMSQSGGYNCFRCCHEKPRTYSPTDTTISPYNTVTHTEPQPVCSSYANTKSEEGCQAESDNDSEEEMRRTFRRSLRSASSQQIETNATDPGMADVSSQLAVLQYEPDSVAQLAVSDEPDSTEFRFAGDRRVFDDIKETMSVGSLSSLPDLDLSITHLDNIEDDLDLVAERGIDITARQDAEDRRSSDAERSYTSGDLPDRTILDVVDRNGIDIHQGDVNIHQDSGDVDTHNGDVINGVKSRDNNVIGKCSNLTLTLHHDVQLNILYVTVHDVTDMPNVDRGGCLKTQVRVVLLPEKKLRHKTKMKSGTRSVSEPGLDAKFDETFEFKVKEAEDLPLYSLRLRLYGFERLSKERLLGETILELGRFDLKSARQYNLTLEARADLNRSDSGSSHSLQIGCRPELLVGLQYNETTGRLSVEIVKGCDFKLPTVNKPPDTYVKLSLMSGTGEQLAESKTSVRRTQPNPQYKETFMFQVAHFQMKDVSLMVAVYCLQTLRRKHMLGWFTIGDSCSSPEGSSHWRDVWTNKTLQVCRWHTLLDP